jgi:hypothetical protein
VRTFPASFDPAQQRGVCLGLAAHHDECAAGATDDAERRDHEQAAAACRARAAEWETWGSSPEYRKAKRALDAQLVPAKSKRR